VGAVVVLAAVFLGFSAGASAFFSFVVVHIDHWYR
jgi:hypothetical protein